MAITPEKPTLVGLVSSKSDPKFSSWENRYLHVTVTVQYVSTKDDWDGAGHLRNFLDDSDVGRSFADLQLDAQMDETTEHLYGYHVRFFDVFGVDLRRAEAMVKTLRKVERGLAKDVQTFGYPDDFGEYVLSVGRVLGIKQYWQRDPHSQPMNPYYFKTSDATYLRGWIKALEDEWKLCGKRGDAES